MQRRARHLIQTGAGAATLVVVTQALGQATWEEAPADPAAPQAEPPTADPQPAPASAPPPGAAEPSRPVPPPPPPPASDHAASGQSEGRVALQTAPVGPALPRTRRRHDGFYLRMNGGLGALSTDVDFDSRAGLSLSGGALMLDFMLGGTPAPGLTIGGGLWIGSLDEPDAEVEDSSYVYQPRGGTSQLLVGPFIDAFPHPSGGFHFGAAFGIGAVSLPEDDGISDDRQSLDSAGAGAAIFGGWDWWISANWSLGFMIRLMAIRTREDSLNYDTTARSFGLLFSALYH